jgi:Phage integrase, N-terminal SAM-like domain
MTTLVRVQRVVMPSGVESATVVADGDVVDCADRFLAHLTAIERSPNTVRAYAHDLRDFLAFLESRGIAWDAVVLEDLGKFVAWLRLSGAARDGQVMALPWPTTTPRWVQARIASPIRGRGRRRAGPGWTRRASSDVDQLLATHHLLTGPRHDPDRLPTDQQVISARHTDRQSTLLVRTDAPILDPAWTVEQVGLEDLVLAYMSQASNAAGLENGRLRGVPR